jgi:hypothetical protein
MAQMSCDGERDHTPPSLLTPGVIAAELNVPLHRVLYILATRATIRPAARAGILRLYTRASLELVRLELAHIGRHRAGPAAPVAADNAAAARRRANP